MDQNQIDALVKKMDKLAKEVKGNPELATKLLQNAGILDEQGEIQYPYK